MAYFFRRNKEPKRNELCDLYTFCNIQHCGNCIHCEDKNFTMNVGVIEKKSK